MSGPKSSRYDAAEARRARELAAAQRVLAAAVRDAEQFNRSERKSAKSIFKVDVATINTRSFGGGSPEEIHQQAAALRGDTAAARANLDQRCGAAQATVLHGMFSKMKVREAPSTAAPTSTDRTRVLDEQLWKGRIERAVDDLPARMTDDEREQATRYATMAGELLADPSGRADSIRSLVTALNRLSHDARAAAEHRAAQVARATELEGELCMFDPDEEGTQLLNQIQGVVDSDGAVALPSDFDQRVARYNSRRAKEVAESDRLLVLRAAREALIEQGFDVGEESGTPEVVDWLATTAGSDTALRVRERDGELQFNLVRVETESTPPEGSTSRSVLDEEAEEKWCESFDRVQENLAAKGMDLNVTSRALPGERPIHAMTPDEIGSVIGADARDRVLTSAGAGRTNTVDTKTEKQRGRERLR